MTPYEITYTVDKYENSVIVQAESDEGARAIAFKWFLIPQGAEITKVEQRGG